MQTSFCCYGVHIPTDSSSLALVIYCTTWSERWLVSFFAREYRFALECTAAWFAMYIQHIAEKSMAWPIATSLAQAYLGAWLVIRVGILYWFFCLLLVLLWTRSTAIWTQPRQSGWLFPVVATAGSRVVGVHGKNKPGSGLLAVAFLGVIGCCDFNKLMATVVVTIRFAGWLTLIIEFKIKMTWDIAVFG